MHKHILSIITALIITMQTHPAQAMQQPIPVPGYNPGDGAVYYLPTPAEIQARIAMQQHQDFLRQQQFAQPAYAQPMPLQPIFNPHTGQWEYPNYQQPYAHMPQQSFVVPFYTDPEIQDGYFEEPGYQEPNPFADLAYNNDKLPEDELLTELLLITPEANYQLLQEITPGFTPLHIAVQNNYLTLATEYFRRLALTPQECLSILRLKDDQHRTLSQALAYIKKENPSDTLLVELHTKISNFIRASTQHQTISDEDVTSLQISAHDSDSLTSSETDSKDSTPRPYALPAAKQATISFGNFEEPFSLKVDETAAQFATIDLAKDHGEAKQKADSKEHATVIPKIKTPELRVSPPLETLQISADSIEALSNNALKISSSQLVSVVDEPAHKGSPSLSIVESKTATPKPNTPVKTAESKSLWTAIVNPGGEKAAEATDSRTSHRGKHEAEQSRSSKDNSLHVVDQKRQPSHGRSNGHGRPPQSNSSSKQSTDAKIDLKPAAKGSVVVVTGKVDLAQKIAVSKKGCSETVEPTEEKVKDSAPKSRLANKKISQLDESKAVEVVVEPVVIAKPVIVEPVLTPQEKAFKAVADKNEPLLKGMLKISTYSSVEAWRNAENQTLLYCTAKANFLAGFKMLLNKFPDLVDQENLNDPIFTSFFVVNAKDKKIIELFQLWSSGLESARINLDAIEDEGEYTLRTIAQEAGLLPSQKEIERAAAMTAHDTLAEQVNRDLKRERKKTLAQPVAATITSRLEIAQAIQNGDIAELEQLNTVLKTYVPAFDTNPVTMIQSDIPYYGAFIDAAIAGNINTIRYLLGKMSDLAAHVNATGETLLTQIFVLYKINISYAATPQLSAATEKFLCDMLDAMNEVRPKSFKHLINKKSKRGLRPLHYLAGRAQSALFTNKMITLGANPLMLNDEGMTPVDTVLAATKLQVPATGTDTTKLENTIDCMHELISDPRYTHEAMLVLVRRCWMYDSIVQYYIQHYRATFDSWVTTFGIDNALQEFTKHAATPMLNMLCTLYPDITTDGTELNQTLLKNFTFNGKSINLLLLATDFIQNEKIPVSQKWVFMAYIIRLIELANFGNWVVNLPAETRSSFESLFLALMQNNKANPSDTGLVDQVATEKRVVNNDALPLAQAISMGDIPFLKDNDEALRTSTSLEQATADCTEPYYGALMQAIRCARFKSFNHILEQMKKAGIDLNRPVNKEQDSLLLYMLRFHKIEADTDSGREFAEIPRPTEVFLLLAIEAMSSYPGFAINQSNANGITALHLAAGKCQSSALVKKLIDKGAHLLALTINGYLTPLEYALCTTNDFYTLKKVDKLSIAQEIIRMLSTPAVAKGIGCEIIKRLCMARENSLLNILYVTAEDFLRSILMCSFEIKAVKANNHKNNALLYSLDQLLRLSNEEWEKAMESGEATPAIQAQKPSYDFLRILLQIAPLHEWQASMDKKQNDYLQELRATYPRIDHVYFAQNV